MPEVALTYDPKSIGWDDTRKIQKELPAIVARFLGCDDKGGGLTPGDVEVHLKEANQYSTLNGYGLMIHIDASEFPSRKKNLKGRNNLIARAIRPLKPKGVKAYVFTMLHRAAFNEF